MNDKDSLISEITVSGAKELLAGAHHRRGMLPKFWELH